MKKEREIICRRKIFNEGINDLGGGGVTEGIQKK